MVDMDSVMSVPDAPEADLLALHETRSFTDTRDLLATDIQAAFDFVETSPHKRLWLLMAEAALVQLNFQLAIKAFVLKDDYKGVQYVKQVRAITAQKCVSGTYVGALQRRASLWACAIIPRPMSQEVAGYADRQKFTPLLSITSPASNKPIHAASTRS